MKEKTCAFTGRRPKDLYGYDYSDPRYEKLNNVLKRVIEGVIDTYGVDTFISGGALGFDTIAFEAVEDLKILNPKIKNDVAIPFKGQETKWNSRDRKRYETILSKANEVFIVDELKPVDTSEINEYSLLNIKYENRNKFMCDSSIVLISCSCGEPLGGTYRCMLYGKRKNMVVININPRTYEVSVYNKG